MYFVQTKILFSGVLPFNHLETVDLLTDGLEIPLLGQV